MSLDSVLQPEYLYLFLLPIIGDDLEGVLLAPRCGSSSDKVGQTVQGRF